MLCGVKTNVERAYSFLMESMSQLKTKLYQLNIFLYFRKNYETNRLESGLLQLSEKTHLVLDETKLQPGQLNDKGKGLFD